MVASIKPHRDALGLTDGQLLIDGTWQAAQSSETWTHLHPATGEEVASFPVASAADVDKAVRAARRAFDEGPWPRSRAKERIRVLRRAADLIRERADELALIESHDVGKPITFATVVASSGFATRTVYQPTIPLRVAFRSSR